MNTSDTRPTGTRHRTAAQLAALLVGLAFLAIGILGFVPGITTNYDSLAVAGHESGAMLLGLFTVSVLHNIVHLVFGVAGIVMSRTIPAAFAYLFGGGVIYLVLALYGVLVEQHSNANFIPVNHADNWLHLGLGAGMILIGLLTRRAAGTRIG